MTEANRRVTSVRRTAALLSRASAIEVLFHLDDAGESRAKELLLAGGSEASVVRRLRELTDAGLIERSVLEDRTTRYSLTARGSDLVSLARKLGAINTD